LEYKDNITMPKPGRWKSMTDTEIWLSIMGQVGVVGNSAPAIKMCTELDKRKDWYETLNSLKPAQQRKTLHNELCKFRIRYVSEDPDECRKTNALLKNLALIEAYGGPKKYIQRVAKISEDNLKVATIIDDMCYIKNKGARDFLINLGLIENAIAFDVRIKKILVTCGVKLPDGLGADKTAYKQLESELIEKVCKTCGVTGAVFDRLLYQNYKQII